jgi:hypothetical protein
MSILCNLTGGLVLAAILIVPQYASAAPQTATVRCAETELCRAKLDLTYIGPR